MIGPDVNERLQEAGSPYRLAIVSVESLELLEKNARFMTNETFRNLVENVRRDGGLSSLPFCVRTEGGYRVLSGNHRVMAAKEAGLTEIPVLFTEKALSHQEEVAVQLSHNALAGQDDPMLLKALYAEIEDLGLKYYAGLDDKTLAELEKVALNNLAEVRLDFRTITFAFLPEEVDRLQSALEAAAKFAASKELFAVALKDWDRAMDALTKAQSAFNVRNSATGFCLILDIFEAHQEDLQAGWDIGEGNSRRSWVPLASVFGGDRVPVEVAKALKAAVDRMVDAGDLQASSKWKALECWATGYLAG